MSKNMYVVALRLISGETEKTTTSLVEAVDNSAAERIALEGELHCDIGRGAEIRDDGKTSAYATDLYGEWMYRIRHSTLVPKEDEAVLRRFLSPVLI